MALMNKGQAAVTDALYFLLIVTGISILLFSFANSYGNSVSTKITSNYNTTFSTDALKTILYSSTPRDPDPSKSLYDSAEEIEVDHLLAFIKEDFSDDGAISPETKQVLAKDIMGIMSPVSTNFDYAFYISVPNEKFPLFFMKTTDTGKEADPDNRVSYFFCGEKPAGTFSDFGAFEDKITALIVSVGETSSASSRIKLSRVDAQGTIDSGSNAQVDLVIWNATLIPSPDDNEKQFPFASDPVWNCTGAFP